MSQTHPRMQSPVDGPTADCLSCLSCLSCRPAGDRLFTRRHASNHSTWVPSTRSTTNTSGITRANQFLAGERARKEQKKAATLREKWKRRLFELQGEKMPSNGQPLYSTYTVCMYIDWRCLGANWRRAICFSRRGSRTAAGTVH